jgi:hypothetical protein
VMFATNFMRFGGVLTVLFIGYFLLRMFRLERARSAAWAAHPPGVGPTSTVRGGEGLA